MITVKRMVDESCNELNVEIISGVKERKVLIFVVVRSDNGVVGRGKVVEKMVGGGGEW